MTVLLKRLLLSISDTALWKSFGKGGIGLLVLDVPGEEHWIFFWQKKR